MRKAYPSDITREQFELVKHHIEENIMRTRPMMYDLYEILCAVLYYLKEGCKWRDIPDDFPNFNTVYYHFRRWSKKDNAVRLYLIKFCRISLRWRELKPRVKIEYYIFEAFVERMLLLFSCERSDIVGKRKVTWTEIYKEFRKNYPNYAKKAAHFEPNGFLEIVIFMTDGTKMTYDYFQKQLKWRRDTWK